MAEQPTGKLAVIVHADVVGSTVLVQRDERRAHQRITDTFQRFSRTIQEYGGRVHEIRGDALVAEFSRASDAVCAAISFQQDNAAHNVKDKSCDRSEPRAALYVYAEFSFSRSTLTIEATSSSP